MNKRRVDQKPDHCQNCSQPLDDTMDFCPNCGQKALPEHLTVKYLFYEFINNLFSFDSKIFNTVKFLIYKPSFLSSEFISGRRIGYINPVQLFIFSSTIYFLVNSFMFLKEETNDDSFVTFTDGDQKIRVDSLNIEQADSLYIIKDGESSDTINNSYIGKFLQSGQDFNSMDKESQNEKISRNISYSVFLLMPLFAFYLGWLFKRKKQRYLENIIFSLHFHAFYFVVGVVFLLLDKLLTGDAETLILLISVITYLLVAAKRFYGFSWFSTSARFVGLVLIYGITVSIFLITSIIISVLI